MKEWDEMGVRCRMEKGEWGKAERSRTLVKGAEPCDEVSRGMGG